MTERDNLLLRVTEDLAKREISEHIGRWCEVTLKRTGETIKVVRTGYGSMERPQTDPHDIWIGDERVGSFKNLREVAEWICGRGV